MDSRVRGNDEWGQKRPFPTVSGAGVDLLFFHRGRRYGLEEKRSEAPSLTRLMHLAISDLKLEHRWVVYPGKNEYEADERITVLPVADIASLATRL